MSEEFQHFTDILPDGGIPIIGLRIVLYLGNDGTPRYRFGWSGDGSSVEVVGMLELVKNELVSTLLKTREGDQ